MPYIVLIAPCLQTTGIENGVRQYSGFSSALVLSSQLYFSVSDSFVLKFVEVTEGTFDNSFL